MLSVRYFPHFPSFPLSPLFPASFPSHFSSPFVCFAVPLLGRCFLQFWLGRSPSASVAAVGAVDSVRGRVGVRVGEGEAAFAVHSPAPDGRTPQLHVGTFLLQPSPSRQDASPRARKCAMTSEEIDTASRFGGGKKGGKAAEYSQ